MIDFETKPWRTGAGWAGRPSGLVLGGAAIPGLLAPGLPAYPGRPIAPGGTLGPRDGGAELYPPDPLYPRLESGGYFCMGGIAGTSGISPAISKIAACGSRISANDRAWLNFAV